MEKMGHRFGVDEGKSLTLVEVKVEQNKSNVSLGLFFFFPPSDKILLVDGWFLSFGFGVAILGFSVNFSGPFLAILSDCHQILTICTRQISNAKL